MSMESKMTTMMDSMTVARGILSLISVTVPHSKLEAAYDSMGGGYPRSAIYIAVAVANQLNVPISQEIRDRILTQIDWPEDELEDIMSELKKNPLQAA